jgi:CO/xanthine dehydrogenase Mo-binding subunit
VGSTHTAYVMGTLLDEIAVATNQDPVAYRLAPLPPQWRATASCSRNGEVKRSNFHPMNLPRLTDNPVIDVHIVPSSEPPKGMGEPALPSLAPAMVNAIARLTGKRHRELPFTTA